MRTPTILALSGALTFAFLLTNVRGAEDQPPKAPAAPPVTVVEDTSTFTLANGIVTAKISKRSGDLVSLKYQNLEMLGASGHAGGYWSHAASSSRTTASITIDPKTNNGDRAEVSIKAISGGAPLGNGPGGAAVADIEIRYNVGRGDA